MGHRGSRQARHAACDVCRHTETPDGLLKVSNEPVFSLQWNVPCRRDVHIRVDKEERQDRPMSWLRLISQLKWLHAMMKVIGERNATSFHCDSATDLLNVLRYVVLDTVYLTTGSRLVKHIVVTVRRPWGPFRLDASRIAHTTANENQSRTHAGTTAWIA